MIIRVDPSLLKGFASTMQEVGGEVTSLGSSAASAAQGAPSYDGQFGPQVAAIGAEAAARINSFTSRIVNLSERLNRKAIDFIRADTEALSGFVSATIKWPTESQLLAQWSKMAGIPVAVLERYLKLGMLFGGAQFYSLLVGMVMWNGLFSWTGQTFSNLTRPSWWPPILWPFGQTKPQTPKPTSPPAPNTVIQTGIVEVPVNENADDSDCVAFVNGQPGWKGNVPPNVTNMNGGWAGGARDEKWNYGDVPKPGALMVEAKSDSPKIGATIDGVEWGHISYIKSVEYDGNGNPVKITVVEGRWTQYDSAGHVILDKNGNPVLGKHEKLYDWPLTSRKPEVFIHGKK